MSDELLNRARELLALRDRFDANPDDGRVSDRFADAVPRAFDTIRDLLAEVERLKVEITEAGAVLKSVAFVSAQNWQRADAVEQREAILSAADVKIDGHRFACSQAVADHVARLDADRVAAESRLRELASAEPVAWQDDDYPACVRTYRLNRSHALIRRPSMEGGK